MRTPNRVIDIEKQLLGDSLAQIGKGVVNSYPSVNETTFKNHVAPLLANLGQKDLLMRYQPFVGLLTMPLRVVADHNIAETLFVVPAIVQSPRTTIPMEGGLTVSQMYKTVARDIELGQRQRAELKILSFLTRMVVLPDYAAKVLDPLREILARYGYVLSTSGIPAEPIPEGGTGAVRTTQSATSNETAFTDAYEDD